MTPFDVIEAFIISSDQFISYKDRVYICPYAFSKTELFLLIPVQDYTPVSSLLTVVFFRYIPVIGLLHFSQDVTELPRIQSQLLD